MTGRDFKALVREARDEYGSHEDEALEACVKAGGESSVGAAVEYGRRALVRAAEALPGQRVRGGADLFERFRARMAGATQEEFWCVLLDGRNVVLREVHVSTGTLNAAIVHPRDVFGPAVRAAAASVVLVHNHPSGDPAPSPEDFAVTRRLVESGAILGVAVLDHLVVGAERYCSFLERGLLERGK